VILSTLTILIGLSILGFGMVFLSAPLNLNSVYGSVTPEQEELGTNEDGTKKVYTDCQGYGNYTESLEMTKEEADFNTEVVDVRIGDLERKLERSLPISNDEIEEKECLQAIRAIENNANATLQLEDSTDSLNYIPYSNSNLGVSFEYPSTWTLEEKQNRFQLAADVTVGDGLHLFSLIRFDDDFNKQGVDLLGLSGVAEQTKPADHRMIGQVEENKYIVDGEDSASYVSVNDNSIVNSNAAMETIMVLHDGTMFLMRYQDTQDKFDSPESQQIINHIIDSTSFTDSENSSNSSDDDI
ncbi:MAG: hypothetical protein L0H53_06035, partial [Candidatus Nitrosocosmicus sp.]|nr:hypothetical protein [Candidatus Nitrosocosmicus sp.]